MAITQSTTSNPGIANEVHGQYVDPAASPAAAVLSVGFTPRYFAWHNLTDRTSYEWFEGMAAGTTLKTVAAGTRTLDTGDAAISVDAGSGDQDGAGVGSATSIPGIAPDGTVTIAAAAILQNKVNHWVARA